LVREQTHGPVRLSKVELAETLIASTQRGLADNEKRDAELQRPIVAFIARRIVEPLAIAAFQ
jgi:hypothetical protein